MIVRSARRTTTARLLANLPVLIFLVLVGDLMACGSADVGRNDDAPVIVPPAVATAEPPEERAGEASSPIHPTMGEINGGCAPDGVGGHQTTTSCADGVTFDIDVPDRCLSSPCGIILDVHGWSMNGPMEELHTRLSDLVRDRGRSFIVIHPTAPGKPPSWGKGSYPFSKDFAFDETVWSYFEATATRFHANEAHLHVTGFSQGAMMSFRLAFAHADRLASIAPISGPSGFADPSPLGDATPTGKRPLRQIPILYIHGTKDKELKFDSNAVIVRTEIVKAYDLSTPELLPTGASGGVRASRYRGAPGGEVLFEFWEHDYSTEDARSVGGHCVAGPAQKGDGSMFGKPASLRPFRCVDADQSLDAGMEILRFFEEHPLRNP